MPQTPYTSPLFRRAGPLDMGALVDDLIKLRIPKAHCSQCGPRTCQRCSCCRSCSSCHGCR